VKKSGDPVIARDRVIGKPEISLLMNTDHADKTRVSVVECVRLLQQTGWRSKRAGNGLPPVRASLKMSRQ
jgi:hypothetical protein